MLRLLRHYFYFVPAQLSKAKGIGKNILLKFNQPVFFHPGELRRQCAPVHREIIRELLAVKGDSEGLFLLFFRLKGQVRHHLFPDGPLSHVVDLPRQHEIFLRHDIEKVVDQAVVVGACRGADV